MSGSQKGFVVIPVIIVVLIFGVLVFFAASHKSRSSKSTEDKERRSIGFGTDHRQSGQDRSPVEIGKQLTRGNCEGEGSDTLTHPPMDIEDIGYIVPYGSTVGGHVTPIDHIYLYPEDFYSAPDTYEVYAQADGTIYYLDENKHYVEDTAVVEGDYAIKFSQSCTHLYSYSLLSSLSPKLKKALGGSAGEGETYRKFVNLPVKKGELVGRVGGRTVDYVVLDTSRPLKGFITPELYEVEQEKIYTANPFDYYSEDLTDLMQQKNLRSIEPLGGKIDYDIRGKLRGNWFMEDTYGYAGVAPNTQDRNYYWRGHLSIYPDHIDPTATIISVGDFQGESSQFTVLETFDPANVGVGDGLLKFTLVPFEYATPDGSFWDGDSVVKNLKVTPLKHTAGCALFEMPKEQKLKAEFLPGETCDNIESFSQEVRIYER